jgi:cytochrome c oxidase subunit 2
MKKGIVVAFLLMVVAVGTVAFHLWSPWWWTPIASNWGYIDDTIVITFWVTGLVFVGLIVFMAYCALRYRYREGRRAEYRPENKKLEVWLTVLTAVGVAVMLTPGLFVWNQFVTVPEDAAEVEVMGQQWQWSFRFPGKDGVLGTSNPRKFTFENPFGLNEDDPNAKDDVLVEVGDLHLPIGKPIKMLLRSKDVLHDFYVPEFRAKMDLVPGQVTYFWLIPTRAGTFDILCFELCGVGHHTMRAKVVVEEEGAFRAWLEQQPTFAKMAAQAGMDLEDGLKRVSTEGGPDSAAREPTRQESSR